MVNESISPSSPRVNPVFWPKSMSQCVPNTPFQPPYIILSLCLDCLSFLHILGEAQVPLPPKSPPGSTRVEGPCPSCASPLLTSQVSTDAFSALKENSHLPPSSQIQGRCSVNIDRMNPTPSYILDIVSFLTKKKKRKLI